MDEKVSNGELSKQAQQSCELEARPYAAPRLRYLGSVKDLTLLTAKSGSTFDGGLTPRSP